MATMTIADENRDVDVGEVTTYQKVSTRQRNQWDEDTKAMTKEFRIEECPMAWSPCGRASRASMILRRFIVRPES